MYQDKRVIVVLPDFNAALTLEQTNNEIPLNIVDEVFLVDDSSMDNTVEIGKRLGIKYIIKQ